MSPLPSAGSRAPRLPAWVGDIANTRPVLIGARSLSSSTDQFTGEIDYVAFATGDGAVEVSRRGVSMP